MEHAKLDAWKIFNKYDANSNGFIEREELAALFEDLGLKEMHKGKPIYPINITYRPL